MALATSYVSHEDLRTLFYTSPCVEISNPTSTLTSTNPQSKKPCLTRQPSTRKAAIAAKGTIPYTPFTRIASQIDASPARLEELRKIVVHSPFDRAVQQLEEMQEGEDQDYRVFDPSGFGTYLESWVATRVA